MGRRREQPQWHRALAVVAIALGSLLWLVPPSQAQTSTIVINEIVASNSQIFPDGDGDFEDWIELYNPNAASVDLTGWTIEDSAATWPIPAGTMIDPDGYLIIFASDKGDPADPDFPGPFGELHANFQLTSAGETVTLRDDTTAIVATVTFPALVTDTSYGTDGIGGYVVRPLDQVSPLAANPAPPATPTPTPTPPTGVPSLVFNEIQALNTATVSDGDGDFEDWFELANPTCETRSLDGWKVADSQDTWDFPAGLSLAPGQVLFVWASDKGDITNPAFPGPIGELHTNFRIAAAGETLSLLDGQGFLIAQVMTPSLAADESAVRQSDGSYVVVSGAGVTPGALNPGQSPPDCTATPTPTPTPGAMTPTPTPPPATATPVPSPTTTPDPGGCASPAVLINEIMPRNGGSFADGDGDFPDWIELRNAGVGDVDLTGWTIADSGSVWPFPAGTRLAEDGFVIVFASDKGDPSDPRFPGPAGELHANFRLSGDGESVALTDGDGCVVDAVLFPEVGENESFGRTAAGFGVFRLGFTTPGEPNGARGPVVAPICFSSGNLPIRMNRIVASNDGLLIDGDGDDPDFIELLNRGFDPIDLTLWQLSDSETTWVFPVGTEIAGNGGTLIVWASGKGFVLDDDFPGPAGELHTSFRLSADGEQLTLAEPSSCIVEQVEYPPLGADQAYGFDEQGNRVIVLPGQRVAPCATPGSVVVDALMSRNDAFLADDDGEFEDWFELRNTTDATLDLAGWVLGDGSDAWVVPGGVELGAGETLLVWASGKNRGGAGAALHTNFGLSGDGETLTVGSSLDCPVDEVDFPELDDDQVYRRAADGQYSVERGAAPQDEDDDADDSAAAPAAVRITGGCIAITELMAKNDSTIEDEDGEFGDWIELANLAEETIDLSGWTISDEKDSWTIPDGVEIEPGGFVLIWADEGDRGGSGEELHSTFKLAGEGEPVTLADADGAVIASLSTYPELDDDESFGVNDTGDYVVRSAGESTPGEGPTVDGGCDFELEAAAPADEDDAGASDEDDTTGTGGADDPLPTTGSTSRWPSALGQLLIVSGVGLVSMSVVARRRAHR